MAERVIVTGATGRLGGRVARRLAALGVPQTLLVRDPSRAPDLPGASVAQATYADPDVARVALGAGAEVVFMVSAAEAVDRVFQHSSFVDAAVAAGVRHLVYVSFFGAAPDATFTLARDHAATEEHIRASGLRTWTFLRDNLYADFFPEMVGPDGVLRGPAEDGRVAAVAQDDIADVAVRVITDALEGRGEHEGATYELTGPEAVSLADVATALSEASGRTITYVPETVEEAYASRAGYGVPDWQLDAWVSTYTAIASGELARVTDDVPRLTGHPATPLREVLSRAYAKNDS